MAPTVSFFASSAFSVYLIHDTLPPTHKPEGRNVAEVVESGEGYDYKDIGPRPFHKKAEEALIRTKEVDKILTKAMKDNLGAWSL